MRRNTPPWEDPNDDDEKTVSDCYQVSIDIGENSQEPTLVVFKQSSHGPIYINHIIGDDVISLYEILTNTQFIPE